MSRKSKTKIKIIKVSKISTSPPVAGGLAIK